MIWFPVQSSEHSSYIEKYIGKYIQPFARFASHLVTVFCFIWPLTANRVDAWWKTQMAYNYTALLGNLWAQRYNFQCKQTGHWRWSHPLLIRWQIKFFLFFSCLRIHQRQDLLAALRDLILVGASVGLFLSVVPTSCWYWQF